MILHGKWSNVRNRMMFRSRGLLFLERRSLLLVLLLLLTHLIDHESHVVLLLLLRRCARFGTATHLMNLGVDAAQHMLQSFQLRVGQPPGSRVENLLDAFANAFIASLRTSKGRRSRTAAVALLESSCGAWHGVVLSAGMNPHSCTSRRNLRSGGWALPLGSLVLLARRRLLSGLFLLIVLPRNPFGRLSLLLTGLPFLEELGVLCLFLCSRIF
mmetsp:Transcript_7099/g.14798  ORF Transcript_7099/g.14798 Transcript_7099/m.14798 type:complete len:214 (-) Transcript_7099:615-1256(-)